MINCYNVNYSNLRSLSYALFFAVSLYIGNIHASNTINYIPNGSFEVTTISDIPDAWDQYLGPRIVKDWFSAWVVDRNISYHGKNSLRLTVTNDDQLGKVKAGPYFRNKAAKLLKWNMPNNYGTYTLSLYVKANRDNFRTKIYFSGKEHVINAGKFWQRISFSGRGNAEIGWKYISIIAADKGALWVDAVQLEKGEKATEFVSSVYDDLLFPEVPPASTKAISAFKTKYLKKSQNVSITANRSYFTTEKNGSIIVKTKLPNNKSSYIAELKLYYGSKEPSNLVFTKKADVKDSVTMFDMDINNLRTGEYFAEVNIVKDSKVNFSAKTYFRKLKVKRGEVKVDNQKRCLLVNDKPFNVLAATFLRVHQSSSRWDEFLDMLSKHGYTTVSATFSSRGNNTRSTDEEIIRFFDMAYERGLKVIPVVNPNAKRISNKKFRKIKSYDKEIVIREYINELDKLMGVIGDHPALLSWYLIDEPFGDLAGSGFTLDLVNAAAKIDPYHPVFVSYGNLKRDYDFYYGEVPGDLVAKSYYTSPVRSITAHAENAALMSMATSYNKPVISFIQLWSGLGRYPTPDELTAQTYLGIVHGATGFISWPMMPSSKILWQRTKEILNELKILSPIMYSLAPDIEVSNESKYVHIMTKLYENRLYLIAVNTSKNRQQDVIKFRGTGKITGSVEVMFENKSISADVMSFKADFPALSRRVFVVDIDNDFNAGNVKYH